MKTWFWLSIEGKLLPEDQWDEVDEMMFRLKAVSHQKAMTSRNLVYHSKDSAATKHVKVIT